MTIERDKFLARLAEARRAGLTDIKFCFQPGKAMKPEEIFAALNEVETAVKAGNCHENWQGNIPA